MPSTQAFTHSHIFKAFIPSKFYISHTQANILGSVKYIKNYAS